MATAIATTMNGELNMAYETKALLISLARIAILTNAKEMYLYIAEIANAEGVVLKSWEEAKAQTETVGNEEQL